LNGHGRNAGGTAVVAFHLYDISAEDVAYIMETFPIVKRHDEERWGEYRTSRLIQEIYGRMT
jgi:hypothetical protein